MMTRDQKRQQVFKQICELERQIGRRTPVTIEQKKLREQANLLRVLLRAMED